MVNGQENDINGKYTSADGRVKKGEWVDGKFVTGTGFLEYVDGALYVGDIVDGQPDGEGNRYYPNNEIQYNGNWSKGKYNGHGIYTSADGRVKNGMWKKGVFVEGIGFRKYGEGIY